MAPAAGQARGRTIGIALGVLLLVASVAGGAWWLASGDDGATQPVADRTDQTNLDRATEASATDAGEATAAPAGAVEPGGELTLDDAEDPDELAPPATSRDLIEAARRAGEIDQATALAHRVLAQFHDPALPEAYRGATAGHDVAALVAVRDHLDELSDDLQDRVAVYLRRPTDPDSAFADRATGTSATSGPSRSSSTTERSLTGAATCRSSSRTARSVSRPRCPST